MSHGDAVSSGGRRGQLRSSGLRPGWTTGACATAAARAAYIALTTGEHPDPVRVTLPGGRTPEFALTAYAVGDGWAMAAVTKDAGDDPDVTHGAVVRVVVRRNPPGRGITFGAGPGVGTVTLPGLPLDVGEPAINPMPRAMIRENLQPGEPDIHVEIGVDGGEEIARHTLNGRLGILGGLSILGTTGVVVPYSCSAWIDSIRRGVDVARAAGLTHVAACTGSTSERTARALHDLPELALLDMGDFAGAVLTYLRRHPIARLTICGGLGKMAKLADGHLDLHSARSRVDTDFLASLAVDAEDAGSSDTDTGAAVRHSAAVAAIAASTTALGAWQAAQAHGVPLGDLVAAAAHRQAVRVLAGADVAVEVVCIDRDGVVVGRSSPAEPG